MISKESYAAAAAAAKRALPVLIAKGYVHEAVRLAAKIERYEKAAAQ